MVSNFIFPPSLLNEWHPTRNDGRKLSDFTVGSSKKAWWLGECGHEWEAVIAKRVKYESGCPYCAGRLILAGFNDLASTHPVVAARFVSSLTDGKTPYSVKSGSNTVFVWKGKCGHTWERRVSHEVNLGVESCRVCNHKVLLVGFNDFGTLFPAHAEDWNFVRNTTMPEDFIGAGNTVVWWKCDKGHEWEDSLQAKVRLKSCPQCFFETKNTVKVSDIPSLMSEWDFTKNIVSPDSLITTSKQKIWWLCNRGHSWLSSPKVRLGRLNDGEKVSSCPVCVNRQLLLGFNDLATGSPEIVGLWDAGKNQVTPAQVTVGSNALFWLKCGKGHSWSFRPQEIKGSKVVCPACSGTVSSKQLFEGFNDLGTTHPELVDEWHPIKNVDLTPSMVRSNGGKKVWWVGKDCGHEWEASIYLRKAGTGCPVCSNHMVLVGFNDLATTHPKLVAEWHTVKNGILLPTQFTYGSDVKVWWECDKGHDWKAKIAGRSSRSGCPVCAKIVSGAEREVNTYIESLGIKTLTNVRGIIGDKRTELDIWIPDRNIAVEYNGLYWHSEKYKNKTSHYDKWKECNDKGIQLIQIWEDDWLGNPDVVKSMLAHKLGVADGNKIFARKTKVKTLTNAEVETFYTLNHIQGTAQGSIRLGLTVIDTQSGVEGSMPVERLVAVMVLKLEPGSEGKTLNLLRYATSQPVIGGFTKLLKQAEQTGDIEKIITFSDNTVSDGGLYANNGFTVDKQLSPDYMYVVDGERKHKFGYRLKRFRNDPELQYQEGLTEWELAELNNLPKIWDAGKTRWSKNIHN